MNAAKDEIPSLLQKSRQVIVRKTSTMAAQSPAACLGRESTTNANARNRGDNWRLLNRALSPKRCRRQLP